MDSEIGKVMADALDALLNKKPVTEHPDVQSLIAELVALKAENKTLKKYINELEQLSEIQGQWSRIKVGGFNWKCVECNEDFDVPGDLTTCPYCKSIKIRQTQ